MEKLGDKMKQLEEALAKEEKLRKELEEQSTKLLEEKNNLFTTLEGAKQSLSETEEKLAKLGSLKGDADKQLAELNERLADQEDRNADVSRAKKKVGERE